MVSSTGQLKRQSYGDTIVTWEKIIDIVNDMTLETVRWLISEVSDWSLVEIGRVLVELKENDYDENRLRRADQIWKAFEDKFESN